MLRVALTTAFVTMLSTTSPMSEELYSYFEQSDDPPHASLTISPCRGEIVEECVSHSFSCNYRGKGKLEFSIYLTHFETIASSIIHDITGYDKAELKFAHGRIPLTITSALTWPNGMDGGWVATIGVGDEINDFFQALTEKNSEGASLIVTGKRFPLAPQKGDGKKLVAWKNACIALQQQSAAKPASYAPDTKPDCDFNSRLYRASPYKDPDPTSYQKLQFTDGSAAGTVALTEYRQGQAVWTAHGHFACSNGASICRINFPTMVGQPVELAYEVADGTDDSPETVVIPSLRQEVYQTQQYAVMQGKAYGGLVADFLNGFKPSEDELTLPYNVYRYAGCK